MRLKVVMLASILFASPLNPAFADSCNANIKGGQDTRY